MDSARNGPQQAPIDGRRAFLGRVRSAQDFAAGLFLLGIAGFAFYESRELTMGSLRQLGPGMMPHTLAVLLGFSGIALVVNSLLADGPSLERWSLRGPVFVFGAAIVFAITVRPLGLAVAGPLLIVISGMASHETRWKETFIFGLAMTAFCLVLFRLLLSLPIPVAPWLIGY